MGTRFTLCITDTPTQQWNNSISEDVMKVSLQGYHLVDWVKIQMEISMNGLQINWVILKKMLLKRSIFFDVHYDINDGEIKGTRLLMLKIQLMVCTDLKI